MIRSRSILPLFTRLLFVINSGAGRITSIHPEKLTRLASVDVKDARRAKGRLVSLGDYGVAFATDKDVIIVPMGMLMKKAPSPDER